MTAVFPPDRPNPPDLVPFAEARAGVLERLAPLPVREAGLADALGCVLATDIAAAEDLPPFANSAMDGFAVRGADLAGAGESSPVAPADHRRGVRRDRPAAHRRAGRGRPHHDRGRAAPGGGHGGAGRADRRRRRHRAGPARPRPGPVRPRGRRGRPRWHGGAGAGTGAGPGGRRHAGLGRPQGRARPPPAAGHGRVHRRRAGRPGRPARARPDPRLELLAAGRPGPLGRGRGVPLRAARATTPRRCGAGSPWPPPRATWC